MEPIFVLDIGTRVVIGLLMNKNDQGYEILASARVEHTQRAMFDGQVHDVNEAAKAVREVKKELELKTGLKLKKVAVAAAGRTLCTEIGSAIREEVFPIRWEKEDILSLEMEALQEAMNKVKSLEMDNSNPYCVGYSTVKQMLEGQCLISLVGQRGKKAEITNVATFLPRTVIDGLVAVLERADLEMAKLTLEPIAAGQAAIPQDMRRMNLALVDIGAGTADIAITKDGSFFSYGMVPLAGDEVTEQICAHYLLDFQEGERVKKALNSQQEIEITNFFGEKTLLARSDILEIIKPTVQTMAERIAQEIMKLNENKPQAVILVGGGSLTPLLSEFLSRALDIPSPRIGIQVRERISKVWGDEANLNGADVITSIGIGIIALEGKGLGYYSVRVNDVNIPLFQLKLVTVAEALVSAGIHPRTFLGRPGAALIYYINGEIKVLKGGLGKPAQILVNGEPAKLEQHLKPNDYVQFVPGSVGTDARAQLKNVIEISPAKRIMWNGEEEELKPVIYMNEKKAEPEDWLEDGCKITVFDNKTLGDLLKIKGINLATGQKVILVNNQTRKLGSEMIVKVNGQIKDLDYILKDNDKIEVIEKKITVKDLQLQPQAMNFTVNGKEFLLPPREVRVISKGKVLAPDEEVYDGMELIVEGFSRKPILSELFPYLNLTAQAVPGGRLEMLVNGQEAEFTTELTQGDRIIIKWVVGHERERGV
ncbi:MAG TPA: ATPase [Peptococcaceae bacterium]|nr:ATPase [Peptococcaceae bacterium]